MKIWTSNTNYIIQSSCSVILFIIWDLSRCEDRHIVTAFFSKTAPFLKFH